MRSFIFFPLVPLLVFFQGCVSGVDADFDMNLKSSENFISISFGSCNRQDLPQPLWSQIAQDQTQLFIWLGDNVYADTENMLEMERIYEIQKQQPEYQSLLSESQVIGIWDDHDFGVNDGGKDFAFKDESKQLMLDFLDVPKGAAVRSRTGAYQSYDIESDLAQVRVLLLDTRYFRDNLEKKDGHYVSNTEGTILGEKQWLWLESMLDSAQSDLVVIGSSIQVIPTEHRFEKWSNFPNERARLLDLIARFPEKKIVILSGDRHMAEISELEVKERLIVEITSSGLTHSWRRTEPELNRHRVGEQIFVLNYGLLKITKEGETPVFEFQIKSETGAALLKYTL